MLQAVGGNFMTACKIIKGYGSCYHNYSIAITAGGVL
jgi:hypothetical protein